MIDGTNSFGRSTTSAMGKLYYGSPTIQLADLSSERVLRVIDRLVTIARVADRLPKPQVVVRIGPLGRFTEKHPVLFAIALLCGVLAVLGGGVFVLLTMAVVLSRRRKASGSGRPARALPVSSCRRSLQEQAHPENGLTMVTP